MLLRSSLNYIPTSLKKAPQLHSFERLIVPAICFFQRKFLTKQKMSKPNKGTWAGHSLPERLDFVYLNKTISIDNAFVEKLSKTTFAMSVLKSVQGKGMRWVLALHPINNKGCIPKRQQRSGIYKSINISHVLSPSSQSLTTERKVISCLSRAYYFVTNCSSEASTTIFVKMNKDNSWIQTSFSMSSSSRISQSHVTNSWA